VNNSLRKVERLNRKKLIEQLFAGGSSSFALFPLRVVYLPLEADDSEPVSILISVSKRRFKRAVKRNCLKRRIREAYRKQKQELYSLMQSDGRRLVVAFIYVSDKLIDSSVLEQSMKRALQRIAEQLHLRSEELS
jgi:ribonuclease P protein component